MPTQAERRERTTSRILDCAEGLFIERGFASTTTSDILECAGVSKGALYHHFASKTDVMAAVYERTSSTAIAHAARRSGTGSPLDVLIAGSLAWLDVVRRPEVGTILLAEGPAALGWERCRAIEERASLRLMEASVRTLRPQGSRDPAVVTLTARMINAVLGEAALTLAAGDVTGLTVAQTKRSVEQFLTSLSAGSLG